MCVVFELGVSGEAPTVVAERERFDIAGEPKKINAVVAVVKLDECVGSGERGGKWDEFREVVVSSFDALLRSVSMMRVSICGSFLTSSMAASSNVSRVFLPTG